MDMDMTRKHTCKRCGGTKPATPEHFRRDRGRTSGLDPVCKDCRKSTDRNRRRRAGSPDEAAAALAKLQPVQGVTAEHVKGVLAGTLLRLAEHPADRDLQSAARVIAQLGGALRGYYDLAEYDAQLRELRKRVNLMEDERKRGRAWPTADDFRDQPHPDAEGPN